MEWRIPKYLTEQRIDTCDSKPWLQSLGFEIIRREGIFYIVSPPKGWTMKKLTACWTAINVPRGLRKFDFFIQEGGENPYAYIFPNDHTRSKSHVIPFDWERYHLFNQK
jgi:hypothetical protein